MINLSTDDNLSTICPHSINNVDMRAENSVISTKKSVDIFVDIIIKMSAFDNAGIFPFLYTKIKKVISEIKK